MQTWPRAHNLRISKINPFKKLKSHSTEATKANEAYLQASKGPKFSWKEK